ncbi:MAG: hypothetical protein LBR10_14920 [Prevotellaceae bacterium]|jgi:hypothetical protein|nr:hypothetical protein [Prevotellaceae bacterium]
MGYETSVIREILLSSVKEVVPEISLKEKLQESDDVIVRPKVNKGVPLNTMAIAGGSMA